MGEAHRGVSAIIPTFNRVSYIEAALKSVLSQSTTVDEIIIVDDGSTDGTDSLLADYLKRHPQIVYLRQPNRGVAAARNLGLLKARFPVVAFLDSDDRWLPHHVEEALNCFAQLPDVAFLYAKYDLIDADSRVPELEKHYKYERRDYSKKIASSCEGDYYRIDSGECRHNLIMGRTGYSQSSLVIDNRRLQRRILFDENLKFCEDVDYCLMLLLRSTAMAYIDKVGCEYLIHGSNQIATKVDDNQSRIIKYKHIVKHIEKKLLYCNNDIEYIKTYAEISEVYSLIGGLLADIGRYEESRGWYGRSSHMSRKSHPLKHVLLFRFLGVKGYGVLHGMMNRFGKKAAGPAASMG